MENNRTIESAHETIILAYGESRSHARMWFLMLGLVILTIAVVLTGLIFALRPAFLLPSGTILTITTTPRRAAHLPANVRTSLPPVWQSAIADGTSRWPITLALAEQHGKYTAFALLPRWRKDMVPSEQRGLVQMVGVEQTERHASSSIRYTSAFWPWIAHPMHDAFFQADLTPWRDDTQGAAMEATIVRGRIKKNLILTDLDFQATADVQELPAGDLSLRTTGNPSASRIFHTLRSLLLPASPFPIDNPSIDAFSLQLNEDGVVRSAYFRFTETLDRKKISHILGSLDSVLHVPKVLPDASLAIERTEKTDFSLDQSSLSFDLPHGKVSFHEKDMLLSLDASDAWPVAAMTCAGQNTFLHLSTRMTSILASFLGMISTGSSTLDFGERNGSLAICIS